MSNPMIKPLGNSDTLVEMYVRLVRSGKITIDDVPKKYRERVRAIIEGSNA